MSVPDPVEQRVTAGYPAIRLGLVRRNMGRLVKSGRDFVDWYRAQGLTAFAGVRAAWLLRRVGLSHTRRAVLFIGYVEGGLGLGESLRGLIAAMSKTSLPFAILHLNRGVETRNIGPFMPDRYDPHNRYAVNVIEIATDQMPALSAEFGTKRFENSYNILRTYWELPRAPRAWAAHLDQIDEIWAPTNFTADAFRPIFSRKITIVPPCVDVAAEGEFRRSHYGMAQDVFYFLFAFDYNSRAERKNPLAVVDAFSSAFPQDEKVGLVIRTIAAPEAHPNAAGALSNAARVKVRLDDASNSDRRILVSNQTFRRGEMLSLVRQCDCYVSLHRSEGFGFGMAEAMAFGKPVIGTDFSGSKDFLSTATGFPVACALRPVRPDEYVEGEGQVWAEPDHEAAVDAMRRVYFDREVARQRGAAAAAFVATHFGGRPVALIAEENLRAALRTARRGRRNRSS